MSWPGRRPSAPPHPDFGEDTPASAPTRWATSCAPVLPDGADAAMDFASMESIVPRMREAFFAETSHRSS